MNDIYARLGDVDEDEMNKLMEEAGTIQDMLTMHDFYMIDAKVEEVARALGLLDLGLDKDVTDLSGGQRTKVLMGKLLLEKPDILLWMSLQTIWTWSILSGLSDILMIMRMHLFLFLTTYRF